MFNYYVEKAWIPETKHLQVNVAQEADPQTSSRN